MRWIWRLLTLVVLLLCLRVLLAPQPNEFISWPVDQAWVLKMQGEIKRLQQYSQDFPASLQIEMRRIWSDFHSDKNGEEV